MLAAHTASIYSAACTVSCAAAYTAHYSQLQLGADIIVSSNSMGARKIRATMTRWAPPQVDPHPPSSPLSKLGSLITLGAKRRRRRRGLTSTITLYYIHSSHISKEATIRSPLTPTLTNSGTGRTYQRDSIVGCIT